MQPCDGIHGTRPEGQLISELNGSYHHTMEDHLATLIGYFLTLIASLIAVWQAHLKNKAQLDVAQLTHELEQRATDNERRFQTYKQILPKIDRIDILSKDPPIAIEILEDYSRAARLADETVDPGPDGMDPALRALVEWPKHVEDWRTEQRQLVREVNELALECSPSTLTTLRAYTAVANEHIDLTARVLMTVSPVFTRGGAPERLANHRETLTNSGAWLASLKPKLEANMRDDLGLDNP